MSFSNAPSDIFDTVYFFPLLRIVLGITTLREWLCLPTTLTESVVSDIS